MRVEICFEDAIQYEWFIIKDAIEFPDEVPLTWGYDWQRLPIGKATDIRREDDGAITTELVFNKPEDGESIEILLKNHDVDVSMYGTNVTDERFEDLKIIHKATLRAVVIIMSAAYPKIPEGVIPNG